MASPASQARGLLRRGLSVALAVGLVALVWRLGAPGRAAAEYATSTPGFTTTFGGPRRPPRTLRLAFGAPEGRATLVEGFSPTEPSVLPAGVELKGESGVMQLSLAPDPAGIELVVLGSAAAHVSLEVRVGGADAGTLTFGPEPSLSRVLLPAAALVADRNRIELVRSSPGGTVTLLAGWLGSWSMEAIVRLDQAPPASLQGGWSDPEQLDGRHVRRLKSQASVAVGLSRAQGDYALLLTGRSVAPDAQPLELGVSLSGRHLIEHRFGAVFQSTFVALERFGLVRPVSKIELLPLQAAGEFSMERVGLVPLLPERLLDIGRDATRPYLDSGFSFDEALGQRDGAWSEGGTSRLFLLMDPAPDTYVLTLAAQAFHALAPLDVRVELNQKPLGRLELGSHFGIYELTVPRAVLERGPNELALTYAATRAPKESDSGSTDARELGIFMDFVELRRASPQTSLASSRAR